MTDQERIVATLAKYKIRNQELADDLLNLFIGIAGERLIEKEKLKVEIYQGILEGQMTKPEFYGEIYSRLMLAKEKIS